MKALQKIKNETFTIEKALSRIVWRFTNENVKINESKIIINELDQKAVKHIETVLNNYRSSSLNENELFAKLFCYAFKQELLFYNGNGKLAQKKLLEQLKMPLNQHYDEVHKKLNEIEVINFIKSIEKQQNSSEVISSENQKELIKKINNTWQIDQVYKSLNKTISECLNRFM